MRTAVMPSLHVDISTTLDKHLDDSFRSLIRRRLERIAVLSTLSMDIRATLDEDVDDSFRSFP